MRLSLLLRSFYRQINNNNTTKTNDSAWFPWDTHIYNKSELSHSLVASNIVKFRLIIALNVLALHLVQRQTTKKKKKNKSRSSRFNMQRNSVWSFCPWAREMCWVIEEWEKKKEYNQTKNIIIGVFWMNFSHTISPIAMHNCTFPFFLSALNTASTIFDRQIFHLRISLQSLFFS